MLPGGGGGPQENGISRVSRPQSPQTIIKTWLFRVIEELLFCTQLHKFYWPDLLWKGLYFLKTNLLQRIVLWLCTSLMKNLHRNYNFITTWVIHRRDPLSYICNRKKKESLYLNKTYMVLATWSWVVSQEEVTAQELVFSSMLSSPQHQSDSQEGSVTQ